jgi:hypothetical protein
VHPATQDDTLITSLREPGTTKLCSSQPYGSHRSRSWLPQFDSGASAVDTDLPQCQVQWQLYCVRAAVCTTRMYSAEKRINKKCPRFIYLFIYLFVYCLLMQNKGIGQIKIYLSYIFIRCGIEHFDSNASIVSF